MDYRPQSAKNNYSSYNSANQNFKTFQKYYRSSTPQNNYSNIDDYQDSKNAKNQQNKGQNTPKSYNYQNNIKKATQKSKDSTVMTKKVDLLASQQKSTFLAESDKNPRNQSSQSYRQPGISQKVGKIFETFQKYINKKKENFVNQIQQDQDKKPKMYQSNIQTDFLKKHQILSNKNATSYSQIIDKNQTTKNQKMNQFFTNEELFNKKEQNQQQNNNFMKNSVVQQKFNANNISNNKIDEQNQQTDSKNIKDYDNLKDEYHEYKKLQEKLNFLESKIMSIKTNIDNTYQREKQSYTNSTNPQQQQQQIENKQKPAQQTVKQSSQPHSKTPPPSLSQQSLLNQPRSKIPSQKNTFHQERTQQDNSQASTTTESKNNNTQNQANGSLNDFVTQVKSPFDTKSGYSNQQYQKKTPKSTQSQQHIKMSQLNMNQKERENSLGQQKQNLYNSQSPKNNQKPGQQLSQSSQNFYHNDMYQIQRNAKNQNGVKNPQKKLNQKFIYYVSTVLKSYIMLQDTGYFMNLARDHFVQTIQAIAFVKGLRQPTRMELDNKKIRLDKIQDGKFFEYLALFIFSGRKTIVFDLDETLIHCQESTQLPSDVVLPIRFPTGEIIEAGINIRPYCVQTLQELSKIFEIIVFTASHSCYANVVLDYLDPHKKYIKQRLFREHCIQTDEGIYVKDLRVLTNRSLSDVIIVDNAAYSFGFQIDNGLPILPYYDNKSDMELKHLTQYLKNIVSVKDVREVNRRTFKIQQYIEFQDPIDLLSTLFNDLEV